MEESKEYESFKQILPYYENLRQSYNQESLVELLREVQEIYGYIPFSIQEEIAEEMHLKETVISSIIKIYPSLKSVEYRHKITLCMGERCFAKKSRQLLEAIEKELGIKKNEITPDKRFLLTTQNCLKRCKSSPNFKIDDDYYTYAGANEIPKILSDYK